MADGAEAEGVAATDPKMTVFGRYPVETEPVYRTTTFAESQELYVGELEIELEGQWVKSPGRIRFEWVPRPRTMCYFTSLPERLYPLIGEHRVRLGHNGPVFPLRVQSASIAGGDAAGVMQLDGQLLDAEKGDDRSLNYVIFHVANFLPYHAAPIRDATGTGIRSARDLFAAEGWRITFDGVRQQSKKFLDELSHSGSYSITHVGRLERLDGTTFASTDARAFLRRFGTFLSFARGVWVSPILAIGFSGDGLRVWEDWRAYKVDRWRNVGSWFNVLGKSSLQDALAGFLALLGNPLWAEPLDLAVHWYVESNVSAGGIEGSIVLVQAAFELFAYTLLVEDLKVLSKNGFGNLPASDKIRLTLTHCRIPLSVPTHFKGLADAAKEYNWPDGPEAIASMRNALVHADPDKRKKVFGRDIGARQQTWTLSLWYLELLLLWRVGYGGQFSSRVSSAQWLGQEMMKVPWA